MQSFLVDITAEAVSMDNSQSKIPDSVHRWFMPLGILLLAFVAWQVGNSSDVASSDSEPIVYTQSVQTPVLSARRIPQTLQNPFAESTLETQLSAVVEKSAANSCIGVQRGDRLIGANKNLTTALVPASNQKIVTTYAAFKILKPNFRFTTKVVTANQPVGGVVTDLYLVGGGDPYLSTDNWWTQYKSSEGRYHTRLEDLADQIKASGVTEISGTLIGDDSAYDDVRVGPWAQRLVDQEQSGPLSALVVNEGYTDWPENFINFGSRSRSDNAALSSVSILSQLLEERGVTVNDISTGVAPDSAVLLTSIQSPTLEEIATHINSYSSNIGAELLLKEIGLARSGVGSTEAGVKAAREALEENNIDASGVRFSDGSGLAETNVLTCKFLLDILVAEGANSAFAQTMSIGGQRGSLRNGYANTAADGKVFAKTGTLNAVTALSGYVQSASQENVATAFAYIVNESPVSLSSQALRKDIVLSLAAYPQGPEITELSPQPAIAN